MIIKIIIPVVALEKPRFTITPPVQVTGYLKQPTILQCHAVGYPVPEIKWTRFPPSPLPQGRSMEINGSLDISSVEDDDEGDYTCIAKNKLGLIMHRTFLKVKSVGKLYYIVTVN